MKLKTTYDINPTAFKLRAGAQPVSASADAFAAAARFRAFRLPAVTALLLSVSLAFSAPAYAAGMYGTEKPAGLSEEAKAALKDNVIEWSETGDLIENCNPTFLSVKDSASSMTSGLPAAYDDFAYDMKNRLDDVKTVIDDIRKTQHEITVTHSDMVIYRGELMPKEEALELLQRSYDKAADGRDELRKALITAKPTVTRSEDMVQRGLEPLKNNLDTALKQLLIAYKTLEINGTMLDSQAALTESMVSTYSGMLAQGLITEAAFAKTAASLDSVRASAAQVNAAKASLLGNICAMCGYDPSESISIGELPRADRNFMAGRDFEYDKFCAVDGNPTVVEAGHTTLPSAFGYEQRDMKLDYVREKAAEKFDSLRDEILKQTILCEVADNSLKKAELTERSAEIKYAQGMLSRTEYESLKMSCTMYRASAAQTELNLLQAQENYLAAVKGVMSVE